MSSALYAGRVSHARLRPVRHRLRYRLAQGLFDLDELPELGRRLRLFGHNGPAPISFHDRDHGDGSGDLRRWVEAQLAAADLAGPWGGVSVLCMPRMLGFVFNPLSVYFCHKPDGRLAAMLYEVHNTFGERHAYAMATGAGEGLVRQACDKTFYVSPFLPMDLRYRFRVAPPHQTVGVEVVAEEGGEPILLARFAGRRISLTDRNLARLLIAFPGLTLKVVVAIHWEALRLWLRGAPLAPRPRRAPGRRPERDGALSA